MRYRTLRMRALRPCLSRLRAPKTNVVHTKLVAVNPNGWYRFAPTRYRYINRVPSSFPRAHCDLWRVRTIPLTSVKHDRRARPNRRNESARRFESHHYCVIVVCVSSVRRPNDKVVPNDEEYEDHNNNTDNVFHSGRFCHSGNSKIASQPSTSKALIPTHVFQN